MTTAVISTTSSPRIYVGTYAKYNSGSIAGAWLDLDDYGDKDEFYAACRELHNDEADPELMFQDWEGIPDRFISESGLDAEYWDYIETIESSHLDAEVFAAAEDCEIPYESVEDAYQGEYSSDEEFAQEFAESCGLVNDDATWPSNYIDWERAARDLMYDYSTSNGHYFSINY